VSPIYRLRLRCSHGDFLYWIVSENLDLSLEEACEREWNFSCPNHGPQRGRPFQAELKRVIPES
jgi:hypothetical protein